MKIKIWETITKQETPIFFGLLQINKTQYFCDYF